MRWIIFLSVFSALYGGLHVYAIWRAAQAGFHGIPFYAGAIVFTLLMMAMPILVRLVEGHGYHDAGRMMAVVGFSWMGFIFLFFCTGLAEDLYRLSVMGIGKLSGAGGSWILSRRSAFFIVLLLSAAFTVYGSVDAWRIRTEHVVIHTPKIPPGTERLRIVQISDVHLGLIVREGRLRRIVDAVRSAGPDLLICSGDLVDGQMENQKELAAMLRDVDVKHGKFAITGNHEYYAGIRRALGFTEKAGFTILRGEVTTCLDWMSIAGLDDPAGRGNEGWKEVSEKEILSRIPKNHFALLLKHRPYLDEPSLGLFDLQLSGHTHKGQIFPFTLIIKLLYPMDGGRLDLSNGSTLYVSRGSGTWGPPIRFLVPPEVTVIDLVPVK